MIEAESDVNAESTSKTFNVPLSLSGEFYSFLARFDPNDPTGTIIEKKILKRS